MAARNFIEVSFRAPADTEDLFTALADRGMLGAWEQEGIVRLYWAEENWDASVLQDVKGALERSNERVACADLKVNVVPDRDWNSVWAASQTPIRIGRRVRIRQSWHPSDPEFTGVELVIDPKRAFGSGYHATTQLVIEWLEDRVRSGARVLDIGTGSGILAMVALRLGAAFALGIDIDTVALQCATEAAAANGFGPELKLQAISFEEIDCSAFDLVLANLDGRTLRKLCPLLPQLLTHGGFACLSGMLVEDYEEIALLLRQARLKISDRRERAEWLALEVQKTDHALD